MRIVVKVKRDSFSPSAPWRAECVFEGFQTAIATTDRGDAIAGVRRLVFSHFGSLEHPPRCVEFDVVEALG